VKKKEVQIMNKKLYQAAVLLLCLLLSLTACGAKPDTDDNVRTIPSNEEYREYIESHSEMENYGYYLQLQALISKQPSDEVYSRIGEALSAWANEQDIVKIESVEARFSKSLKMNESRNERWANYAVMDAKIVFEGTTPQDVTVYDKLIDSVEKYFEGDVYARHMLGMMKLRLCPAGTDIEVIRERDYCTGGLTTTDFQNYIQPEDEYHVQTIAYDFAQSLDSELSQGGVPGPYIILSHFGINEENELYIRMRVFTQPEDPDAFIASLPDRAEELLGQITGDAKAAEWLDSQGAAKAVIVFAPSWAKEESIYTFDMK